MKIRYTLLLFVVSYAIQAGEPRIVELTQEQKNRVAQGRMKDMQMTEEQSQRLLKMNEPTFNGRYLYDAQPNEETSDTGLSSNNDVEIGGDENVPESTFSKIWSSGKRLVKNTCTMTNAYRCSMLPIFGLGIAWLVSIPFTPEQTTLQATTGFITLYLPIGMWVADGVRLKYNSMKENHEAEMELVKAFVRMHNENVELRRAQQENA